MLHLDTCQTSGSLVLAPEILTQLGTGEKEIVEFTTNPHLEITEKKKKKKHSISMMAARAVSISQQVCIRQAYRTRTVLGAARNVLDF